MGPSQKFNRDPFALPRFGGSREGRKHWWVKNAGFKLVVGKINFRAKKIGGSRKVNWWVRNFCPVSIVQLKGMQTHVSWSLPMLAGEHFFGTMHI